MICKTFLMGVVPPEIIVDAVLIHLEII